MRRQGTQCSLAEEAVSSGSSTTHADSKELFRELLDRLRDCHDNALQELQSKVNKLRKERCFDAQRLEEFYNKNQHLREQQRTLQESVSVLKDRLKSGPCDQCRETARHMKEKQSVFEKMNNLQLVNELVAERDVLKEENKKLRLQLKRLQSEPLHTSVSEPEEGMIPDSPLQPLSFPTVNKMKRKREKSHVRYAEKRLSQPLPDLRKGEPAMALSCHGGAVLVPETCDIYSRINGRTVVGETCGIDDYCEQGSECDEDSRTFLHAVDKQEQMEKDCSVDSETPSIRERFSCHGAEMQEVRKKQDSPKSSVPKKPVEQINAQEPSKKRSRESEQIRPDSLPPCTPRKDPLVSQNGSPYDQSWSLDPEASLSQYDISTPNHPEPRVHSANTDMDCTYVSHSLLVASRKQAELDQANSVTGLGLLANDSLANIFDATSVEEYESCPQDEMSGVDDEHDHEDEQSEEMNEQKQQGVQKEETDLMNEHFDRPSIQARETPAGADPEKSFACMVVVRKKAERRKLQGHTCKECEIYYADLPEEERKKKLSSCSRHRFRYIPPSTPENFWEVGFPSTQTCKERGYIKEDNQPDPRLRRRKPYHATFSPKAKALDTSPYNGC